MISVIIPTYNRAGSIMAALESVLAQTFGDCEIIVVDDGSTDDTAAVLKPWVDGGAIKYLYRPNAGPSAARNAGWRAAGGEWVAFLDSDDRWMPDKLERQMGIVERSGRRLGCVFCNMLFEPPVRGYRSSFELAPFNPPHQQGICRNISSILLTRCILFNQGAMIARQMLELAGGYDESLDALEDYDLALKLSFLCRWGYDCKPLVRYRTGGADSLSAGVSVVTQAQTIARIYGKLRDFLSDAGIPEPPLLQKQIDRWSRAARYAKAPLGRFALRVRNGIYRRTPWFPMPLAQTLVPA